jgi:signal peptidase I
VVVVHPPAEPELESVTRVVAIAGDSVEIANGQLIINDTVIEADYGRHPALRGASDESRTRESSDRTSLGPMSVPPNHVFVLGDDWERSIEGATWGAVPLGWLTGRLFLLTDTSHPPPHGPPRKREALPP